MMDKKVIKIYKIDDRLYFFFQAEDGIRDKGM